MLLEIEDSPQQCKIQTVKQSSTDAMIHSVVNVEVTIPTKTGSAEAVLVPQLQKPALNVSKISCNGTRLMLVKNVLNRSNLRAHSLTAWLGQAFRTRRKRLGGVWA